jgi:hypothetical protein
MPAIVLGLFLLYYPLSLAMYFVNFWFFTMAAFGDFMIIFMLLKKTKIVLYWIILQKLVISTENMKFKIS